MSRPASFAGLLFLLGLPAVAQNGDAKDFVLAVCNGGKVPFDAFAAVNTPPAVVNIAPDACQDVYTGGKNEPAYVGFAFPDAKGQWGAPRRYDFTPPMAKGVLARTNQSVSVRRGNQILTIPAQFTFRAEPRICSTSEEPVDPFNPRSGKTSKTTCSHFYIAGGAYTQKSADAVHKAVESQMSGRPRKRPDFTPHLQNWPDFSVALAAAGASSGMPPGVPRVITIRGTVSKIEEAAPNASEHWIDIFFKEAPDGRFDACSLGPEILSEVFGPNFRTALIGQVIEVEGDIQRYYCRGYKGSVPISLAHQARRSDATQLAAVMIPRTPAAPAKVENPLRDPAELTPKQQEIRNHYANKVAFEVSYCSSTHPRFTNTAGSPWNTVWEITNSPTPGSSAMPTRRA